MSLHTEDRNIILEFTRKPASRILVNTGGSMGGTGGSTGLVPSFTLGCGTWGGSSTSENVSPLNLINIKKVAFGLKNCATMVADDPTFNHPELGSIPGAFGNIAVNTQRISASAPTACAGSAYLSPEQYQNGGCQTGCKNGANIGDEIDAKQLNEIVEILAKVLRGE